MNTHVLGGQGKTTLLISQLLESLHTGGALFVDPNGETIDTILSLLPRREVLVIDPTDVSYPVGFNVLCDVRNKPLLTSLILSTVKAIWRYDKMPTPVLDRTLFNTLAALLEYPNANLLHVERMLTDRRFRAGVLEHVSDPTLKQKWERWHAKKEKDWELLISSTENKAGEFSEDPRIRNIIAQDTTFDLRRLMFDRAVILLRLPQGQLGQKTTLFGSLFLAYVLSIAYERKGLFPFHIFIDDCQHFDTPILRYLLENGRRQNIHLTLTHQYLGQLSDGLRTSLFGSADRRTIFKTGIIDSEFLQRTMPENNTRPLPHDLAQFQALEVSGNAVAQVVSRPLTKGSKRQVRKIVDQSRRRYGRDRVKVERIIETF